MGCAEEFESKPDPGKATSISGGDRTGNIAADEKNLARTKNNVEDLANLMLDRQPKPNA